MKASIPPATPPAVKETMGGVFESYHSEYHTPSGSRTYSIHLSRKPLEYRDARCRCKDVVPAKSDVKCRSVS